MTWIIHTLAFLAMLAGVFLIPLGLPGLWVIVAATLALVLLGSVPWGVGIAAAAAAALAEAAEFFVVKRLGEVYGGSNRAFWGAVVGGMAGLFVGVPVPVIGPLLTALLGTVAGAVLVTYWETRSVARSARVGWGMLLARAAATALKVGAAVGIIGLNVMAWLASR